MAYYPNSYPTQDRYARDGGGSHGSRDMYNGYSGSRPPVTTQPGYYPTFPGPGQKGRDRDSRDFERYNNGYSRGGPGSYDNRSFDHRGGDQYMHRAPPPKVYEQPIQKVELPDTIKAGHNGREWSSGKCDCGEDCSLCCCTTMMWLFPFVCCAYPAYRAHEFGESCWGFCSPCCCPLATLMQRHRIRDREKIKGSMYKDVCATMFCLGCVYCQLVRENKKVRKAIAGEMAMPITGRY